MIGLVSLQLRNTHQTRGNSSPQSGCKYAEKKGDLLMKKKRVVSLLLSLCLSLSLVVPALAAGATLKLKAPDKLPAAGKTFTVEVMLNGNPGINAAQLTLEFDKTVVKCTDAQAGTVLDGMMSAANPDAPDGAMVASAGTETVTANGVMAEFTFEVLKAGDPDFTISNVIMAKEVGDRIDVTIENQEKEPVAPKPGRPDSKPDNDKQDTDKPAPVEPAKPEQKFSDVPADYPNAVYLLRAAELGLINGYADGTFRPGNSVTRGQFAAMFWRMAGSPVASKAPAFKDISKDLYYYPAVSWAAERGFIKGVTADAFQPDGQITRQQAMAILFRYAGGSSGMETALSGIYDSKFTDSASIAPYAKEAVYWGIYNNILTGHTETTLDPAVPATRAEIATFLVRYLDAMS